MVQSIRIWQKRQLRLDKLTIPQRQMVELGAVGLLSVKQRLRAALGPNDTPAKPLTVPYAKYKTRKGKGNRRDLWFTGAMLLNLSVRTVTENSVKSNVTSMKERIKAMANMRREPWLVFSRANRQAVIAKLGQILEQRARQLVISKASVPSQMIQSYG